MGQLDIKIKDIVEMTQNKSVAEIVKDIPVTGEKLRGVLKSVGCKPPVGVGVKGWTYAEGNQEVENLLSQYVPPKRPRKSNNKSKNNSNNASIGNSTDNNNNDNASNENNNDNVVMESKNTVNNDSNNNNNKKGDNMVMEIKDLIKGKGKDDNARVYKGIYFDKDIANFLDNVQHGNKSEIVNKILRQYLTDNELM